MIKLYFDVKISLNNLELVYRKSMGNLPKAENMENFQKAKEILIEIIGKLFLKKFKIK